MNEVKKHKKEKYLWYFPEVSSIAQKNKLELKILRFMFYFKPFLIVFNGCFSFSLSIVGECDSEAKQISAIISNPYIEGDADFQASTIWILHYILLF